MQPSDLLPAAHLANAQAQQATDAEVELPDVYIVNPGGRVVEVPGQLAEKLLLENGYRRATDAEAAPHEELKKANHPAVLKKREAIRVKQEKAAADKYLADLDAETDALADEPDEQPAKKQPAQPASPPTPAPGEQTPPSQPDNGSDEGTPKPPSRATKK